MRTWTIGIAILGVGLIASCGGNGEAEGARSVILISIDSLRADHLGCYGYGRDTSPRIDRLAAEGTRFARALAPSPWTLPSHASLFTGLYPMTHGIEDNGLRLRSGAQTLARSLASAGFATQAIVCAPLLRPEFGLDAGFHGYDIDLVGETPEAARAAKVAPKVTAKALAWLDRIGERPFFLFLHYWDVHYDYNPPDEFAGAFDPDYAGSEDGTSIHDRTDIVPGMDEADFDHLVALYDGEIRYTDEALGVLFDGIEARGLADRTMIWVVADHGEEFLDHGGTGHTSTCYGEVLEVPMILRVPWLADAPAVVSEPTGLVDVLPTTLELLELPEARMPIEGVSVAPALRAGRSLPERVLLAETLRGRPPVAAGKAARRWTDGPPLRWSTLRTADGEALHLLTRGGKTRRVLLFDHRSDPAEERDLSAEDPRTVGRLLPVLRSELSRAADLSKLLDPSETWTLEADMVETLRGLGYVR